MRAFCEAGYTNTMTLDHTPRFVEGYEAVRSFAPMKSNMPLAFIDVTSFL